MIWCSLNLLFRIEAPSIYSRPESLVFTGRVAREAYTSTSFSVRLQAGQLSQWSAWLPLLQSHRYVASMSLASVLSGATIGKAVFGALLIGCCSSVSIQESTTTLAALLS